MMLKLIKKPQKEGGLKNLQIFVKKKIPSLYVLF